jgi:uncharacterized protein
MSYTSESIERMRARAMVCYKSNKKLMKSLNQIKSQRLDKLIHELHISEFNKIECLECANCCKTISPSVFDSDIRRMATMLKIKVSVFIDRYLIPDKDNDFVFNATPCPFLNEDNRCIIYKARPKACRGYPHTDRKRMYQLLDLTARNSKVCPAVFNIVEQLKGTPVI